MGKPKPHERLAEIIETGVDFSRRRIYINGDVDSMMSIKAIAALHILDSTPGLITVYLDTGGGDEYEAWAVYDAFKGAHNNVMVIGLGQVMSAGAILLNMASKGFRFLSRSCRFMIHNGQGCFENNQPHSSVVRALGREQSANDERYAQMLAESSFDQGYHIFDSWSSRERYLAHLQQIKDLCMNETYLSADEALTMNFCDGLFEGETK